MKARTRHGCAASARPARAQGIAHPAVAARGAAATSGTRGSAPPLRPAPRRPSSAEPHRLPSRPSSCPRRTAGESEREESPLRAYDSFGPRLQETVIASKVENGDGADLEVPAPLGSAWQRGDGSMGRRGCRARAAAAAVCRTTTRRPGRRVPGASSA